MSEIVYSELTVPTRARVRPRPSDGDLLLWYALAVVVTTACTLTLLAAVRQVTATEASSSAAQVAATLLWIEAVASPVVVVVKGLAVAVTIWAVLTLFGEMTEFRVCLLAAWRAEVVVVLWSGVEGVQTLLRGTGSPADLIVPLGLDLFWTPGSARLALVSHTVNIFFVGWLLMLWATIVRSSGARPRDASLVAALGTATAVVLGMQLVRFV